MLKLERQVVLPPPQAPIQLDLQKMQADLDKANRDASSAFWKILFGAGCIAIMLMKLNGW